MSFNEILVIVLICVFVCKPQDIKLIIKSALKLKNQFLGLKEDVVAPIRQELEKIQQENLLDQDTVNEINLYIEKITQLNQNYDGEYSLSAVKKYYHQLIIKQDNNT